MGEQLTVCLTDETGLNRAFEGRLMKTFGKKFQEEEGISLHFCADLERLLCFTYPMCFSHLDKELQALPPSLMRAAVASLMLGLG